MKIQVINKSNYALPKYETEGSAGMDLSANIDQALVLKPLERMLIPTGLYISLPQGYEAQIRARSGLSYKHGITVTNGIGTIDSDYRGEICVNLVNISNQDYTISPGDRVAQMVINKYERVSLIEVDELDDTNRSSGGFGHTGY